MLGLDIVYGNHGKDNDDLELGLGVSGPRLDVATILDMPALYSGLKVAPVKPEDHVILDNGFPQGILADDSFVQWVETTPAVQGAVVTSISWWRSLRNILHHQFTITTVLYEFTLPGSAERRTQSYDIRIERMGRTAGRGDTAKQQIIIGPSQPLEQNLVQNDLLYALVDSDNSIINPKSWSKKLGKTTYFQRAFPDHAAKFWRNSPATLHHLARYVSVIVVHAPGYHLSSTNCYFFARLIMSIIGRRHFSFDYLASSNRQIIGWQESRSHEPQDLHSLDARGFPPLLIPQPQKRRKSGPVSRGRNHFYPPNSRSRSTTSTASSSRSRSPQRLAILRSPSPEYRPMIPDRSHSSSRSRSPSPQRHQHQSDTGSVLIVADGNHVPDERNAIEEEGHSWADSESYDVLPSSQLRQLPATHRRWLYHLPFMKRRNPRVSTPYSFNDASFSSANYPPPRVISSGPLPQVHQLSNSSGNNSLPHTTSDSGSQDQDLNHIGPHSSSDPYRASAIVPSVELVSQRIITPPLVGSPFGHVVHDPASESRSSYSHRHSPALFGRSSAPDSSARNDFLRLIESQEREEGIILYRRLYYLVKRVISLLAVALVLGIFLAIILLFTVFNLPNAGVKMAFSIAPVFTIVVIFGCIGPKLKPAVLDYFIDRLVHIRLAIENELKNDASLADPRPPPDPYFYPDLHVRRTSDEICEGFLQQVSKAISKNDLSTLVDLFHSDGWLQNIFVYQWDCVSIPQPWLKQYFEHHGLHNFPRSLKVDHEKSPPARDDDTGEIYVQCFFRFKTPLAQGEGMVRLREGTHGVYKAITLSLVTSSLKGLPSRIHLLDRPLPVQLSGPIVSVPVVIIGGGRTSAILAARLNHLGVQSLIIESCAGLGDSWRNRYHAPNVREETQRMHFPYLTFPSDWPKFLPRETMANWVEGYAGIMELNVLPGSTIEPQCASYDEASMLWKMRIRRQDGAMFDLQSRHVVQTSEVGARYANIPDISGRDEFEGETMHSHMYRGGAPWKGKTVVVVGCGNSGHDIAQDLHASGAYVTMVQRASTAVISRRQAYSLINYSDDEVDLATVSYPVQGWESHAKHSQNDSTKKERDFWKSLTKAGFAVHAPSRHYWGQPGYHVDIGCSSLIISGQVQVKQGQEIDRFEQGGLRFVDESFIPADLVVFATGYETIGETCRRHFDPVTVDRIGPALAVHNRGEEARMVGRTGVPNFWLLGSDFVLARAYSKYMALHIQAIEKGVAPRHFGDVENSDALTPEDPNGGKPKTSIEDSPKISDERNPGISNKNPPENYSSNGSPEYPNEGHPEYSNETHPGTSTAVHPRHSDLFSNRKYVHF